MAILENSYKRQFPTLSQTVNDHPLTYLDNAATTLKPISVIDSLNTYYRDQTSSVHRGVHYLSQENTLKFENTRSLTQHFLNAKHAYEIIFTKGTTESVNMVAYSWGLQHLKEGDEVLITHMEHHSNIVPWQIICERSKAKLKVAPIDDNGDIILEEYQKLLGPKTKLVSFIYVSNTLGTVNPAREMAKMAKDNGSLVFIDGAQAIAHLPVDVQQLDCDFFAFSAHKMFGPTGVGVLYGKADVLKDLAPFMGGGAMIETVSFEKTTYAPLPQKLEAGTPHIAGVIGMGEAIKYISEVGLDTISQYENELTQYAVDAINDTEGIDLIGNAQHKAPVLSFVLDNVHPHDIGTFCDQDGIAIRAGHHCTQPLMKRYNVPATARASFAFYNTKEDIDILINSLKKTREFFQ